MDVAFYQLSKTPLDRALPKLLEKAYGAGLRCLVICESPERLQLLNSVLWTYSPTSFLPHGYEGDPLKHPIWLSLNLENVSNADIAIITSDESIPKDLKEQFKKCIDIFDGNNPQQVQSARLRYKDYATQGYSLTFWQQDEKGNWLKK